MKYASSVVRGKGRGKTLGFPTINLRIPPDGFDFPYGIYAGCVWIGVRKFRAAFHYGPIPTFHSASTSLEAFLIGAPPGFRAPRRAEFELLAYLREIKKFPSGKELSKTMRTDARHTAAILPPLRNRA